MNDPGFHECNRLGMGAGRADWMSERLGQESSLGSFCISVFISVINDRQFLAILVRKLKEGGKLYWEKGFVSWFSHAKKNY